MIFVRLVALLMIVAFVLAVIFLWSRDRRYLRWAWRVFVAALFGMLALLLFFAVERAGFPLSFWRSPVVPDQVSKR